MTRVNSVTRDFNDCGTKRLKPMRDVPVNGCNCVSLLEAMVQC